MQSCMRVGSRHVTHLAVLDGELDSHLEPLPVLGGGANVITDLLR
jgi:hypothetical protein